MTRAQIPAFADEPVRVTHSSRRVEIRRRVTAHCLSTRRDAVGFSITRQYPIAQDLPINPFTAILPDSHVAPATTFTALLMGKSSNSSLRWDQGGDADPHNQWSSTGTTPSTILEGHPGGTDGPALKCSQNPSQRKGEMRCEIRIPDRLSNRTRPTDPVKGRKGAPS